jgi:hypothetical protein
MNMRYHVRIAAADESPSSSEGDFTPLSINTAFAEAVAKIKRV